MAKLIVYPTTDDGKKLSFGLAIECETWREANFARSNIAKSGKKPMVYDSNGTFQAEGWQKN